MAQATKLMLQLLKEIGEDPKTALWKLRGTTMVVKHKAIEKIAVYKNMSFSPPTVIEANAEKKIAVVCVEGQYKGINGVLRKEWSIGESAPYNTTNGYPYAMAEKRAIDRVVLKLLGWHGDIYSTAEMYQEEHLHHPNSSVTDGGGNEPEESDDPSPSFGSDKIDTSKILTEKDRIKVLQDSVDKCTNNKDLEDLFKEFKTDILFKIDGENKTIFNDDNKEQIIEIFTVRKTELSLGKSLKNKLKPQGD